MSFIETGAILNGFSLPIDQLCGKLVLGSVLTVAWMERQSLQPSSFFIMYCLSEALKSSLFYINYFAVVRNFQLSESLMRVQVCGSLMSMKLISCIGIVCPSQCCVSLQISVWLFQVAKSNFLSRKIVAAAKKNLFFCIGVVQSDSKLA